MIYTKGKFKTSFNIGKSDLNKRTSKNKTEITLKEKNSYNKIYDIFNCIYEDLFPKIISHKSKDLFIKEINEKSINILYNNFSYNELQISYIKDNIEKVKEEINNKINKTHSLLEKSIDNIKEKNLNYISHFRKHCSKTEDFAYHLCDNGKTGKFIKLDSEIDDNKKDIFYVVCENCHFCYSNDCIKMYCKNCKKNYYSTVLKDSENINFLPATWDNYHCGTRKKEIMKCLKCKNILYLDLIKNRLICLNRKCNFSSKPEHIIWGCYLCGSEFKSGAKIYNPLEFIILKKVINRALLYKNKAIPPFLPCCHGKIDDTTIFYHKKNCNGILYKYNLNGRDLVVCEKCQALNKFNHFSWFCPLCSQNFTLNNANKENIKRHNYSNSALNIQVNYKQKLNRNSSMENNKNTFSVMKTIDNTSSSLENNVFGFGFYVIKSQADEYAKSKSKNKYNDNSSFATRNKSELNIKNVTNDEESTDRNSKSIEQNNKYRRRLKKRGTLQDILNSRKNTPSFGKIKKRELSESENKDLTARNNYQNRNKNISENVHNSNYNINKNVNIENSLFKNKLIYRRQIGNIKENENSFNILEKDKKVRVNVNKYINSFQKSNNNYKKIDNNDNNKKCNNYYNINNINNINIINSIEIKKDEKSKQANIVSNKENIIDSKKNHLLYISTSQNIPKPSDRNHIIRHSVNQNILIASKLSSINNGNIRKKYLDKNFDRDNIFNKTAENFRQKKISSINIEPFNNEIKSNDINCKKIKVNVHYNRISKINSCDNLEKQIDKDNNTNYKLAQKFSWKKKSLGEFINNNKINIKKEENNNIIKNDKNNDKEKLLNDLISKEKINDLSKKCIIPNFDDKNYNYIKLIGEGSYGKIYLVEDKVTKEEYALKKVICTDYQELLKFKKEFELLYSLKNPNIMRIYKLQIKSLDITTSCLYVLMERAQIDWNIEVKHRKLAKKYYKETEIISILKQLSQGLYFLQKNKIAHRDIKPQNILIFPNNIYKIADMGEAKEIDKNRMQIATLRGSELFMSPLLYEGLKYNKKNIRHNPYKSDMFSLGLCFLYAICLNLKVLEYIREMKDMNSIKSILNKFLDKNIYSNKLIEIIYRMIDLQEEKRFDFEELEKELSKF